MGGRRQAFVAHVRAQVGARFTHKGRLPRVGFDCAGLVLYALERIGEGPPAGAYTGYRRAPRPAQLAEGLAALAKPLPLDQALPGDLLRFDVERLGPVHLAIVLDEQRLLHVTPELGVHECRLTPVMGPLRLVDAWRLNALSTD
jgi:cell wall-associated NlpC family hydrolase